MKALSECCRTWKTACGPGTDNEGYSSLVCDIGGDEEIGLDLPPVRFCPWCGTRKNVKPEDKETAE
jgi:hypothetical protein